MTPGTAGRLAPGLGATLLALAALALVGPVPAAGQDALYRVRGDQLPVATVANGHLQTVTTGEDGTVVVRVTTSWSPVGSTGSYAALGGTPRPSVPDRFSLPRTLDQRLRPPQSAYDAATAVLEWVASSIRLDPNDEAPQDASTVLARRRGRCSGAANATAGLLLAAGFEARTVSGLLVDDNEVVPHRWVECRLPGAGWVPTDPTLGLWIVTPRHIAFSDTVTVTPEVETLALRDGSLDLLPHRQGRRLRPNEGSELVCRLIGDAPLRWPTAVLQGPTGETRRSLLQPEGRFSHLLPGVWQLTVELDGRVLDQRRVELRLGELNTINVEVGPASGVGS